MDTVTQQNAANAEELASSSEELSAQAENLKTTVHELPLKIGNINDNQETSGKQQFLKGHEKKIIL